jgi:hypothetical protein
MPRHSQAPVQLSAYDLVCANDCPERDPCSWVLEGWVPASNTTASITTTANSNNVTSSLAVARGGGRWVVLDQQTGVVFSARHELRTFEVASVGGSSGEGSATAAAARAAGGPAGDVVACTSWRLRVTAARDPITANSVQLACLSLYDGGNSAWRAAATFAGGDGCALVAAQVACLPEPERALLSRVVGNIASSPHDARFRKIRGSKAGVLWQGDALPLLLHLGFRPLIMPTPPVGPSASVGVASEVQDVFLVLAAGEEQLRRVRAAAELLKVPVP